LIQQVQLLPTHSAIQVFLFASVHCLLHCCDGPPPLVAAELPPPEQTIGPGSLGMLAHCGVPASIGGPPLVHLA